MPDLTPTPANACDCHIHVYDLLRYPMASATPSGPPQTTWSDYRAVQSALGLTRALIVQPTGYGFDNRCTLDALAQAGDSARAIVVISQETSDAELAALDAAGVRGVRFMMVTGGGGALAWDMLQPMAARIARFGWTINLQLDGRDLAQYETMLRALPCNLVIDHNGKFLKPVGVDHPGFQSLLRLLDGGRCWVKLSAPYETSETGAPLYEDVSLLAQTFARDYPERCLWASNWPHPGRNPPPDSRALLELLQHWAPSVETRRKILVDNPAHLYQF